LHFSLNIVRLTKTEGRDSGAEEIWNVVKLCGTIYLLTAIGLSPGGSSTVHIYTQTIHRTTQTQKYIEQQEQYIKQHKHYLEQHKQYREQHKQYIEQHKQYIEQHKHKTT
jgi:uncharacterized protein HemX